MNRTRTTQRRSRQLLHQHHLRSARARNITRSIARRRMGRRRRLCIRMWRVGRVKGCKGWYLEHLLSHLRLVCNKCNSRNHNRDMGCILMLPRSKRDVRGNGLDEPQFGLKLVSFFNSTHGSRLMTFLNYRCTPFLFSLSNTSVTSLIFSCCQPIFLDSVCWYLCCVIYYTKSFMSIYLELFVLSWGYK